MSKWKKIGPTFLLKPNFAGFSVIPAPNHTYRYDLLIANAVVFGQTINCHQVWSGGSAVKKWTLTGAADLLNGSSVGWR